MMSSRGNIHVCPGIGTVLYWRPPDVHIFGTDPSLVSVQDNEGSPISNKEAD